MISWCPCSAGSADICLQLLCLDCIWSQPAGGPWSTSGEVQAGCCALVWGDAAPPVKAGTPLLQSWPSTCSSSFPPVPAEGSDKHQIQVMGRRIPPKCLSCFSAVCKGQARAITSTHKMPAMLLGVFFFTACQYKPRAIFQTLPMAIIEKA